MLRGRASEQATIDRLLDAAPDGGSGALVVRGEPGIGKSALLAYARERSPELRVLHASGIESETAVPFAGLHQLLRPARDRLAALPGPQRRALEGAFGLGEPSGDRFMLGAAVLSLLSDLAEDAPVLCLIDDAHWLDRATVDALLFAARRLDREGVVMLFATRDYGAVLEAPGIAELRLDGLEPSAAADLLDDAGESMPPAVRDHLVAATEGNPLALLELPRLISAEGVRAGPIRLTNRVVDAFHHQVRALPENSQRLLLVAAADDTGDLTVVLRAAAELGLGLTELQPAEASGLVLVEADGLAFRHPLVRAAVYHGATLAERTAAHGALAASAEANGDEDRGAWHLAIAATTPDETVAAKLERAGTRQAARNGQAAAATGFERAAQLSPDGTDAVRRMALACEAAVASGQLEWARGRAHRALPQARDNAVRARLLDVLARAELSVGTLDRAHDLLVEAAGLVGEAEPDRAFWMLVAAAHAGWAGPTNEDQIAGPLDQVDDLAFAPDEPLLAVSWLIRWATAVSLGRSTNRYPPLAEVLPRARKAAAGAGANALVEVASFAFIAGRDEVSNEVALELVGRARAEGMLFALPVALGQLALTHVLRGRHREALVTGGEAVRIGRDLGQPMWVRYASGALAYVAAIEGSAEACVRYAADAEVAADAPDGAATGTEWARTALGLLDLGAGRVAEAYDRLLSVRSGPIRHQSAVVRCVPDLVEAAVRLGRAAEVAEAFDAYAHWAQVVDQPWAAALVARCRALLDAGSAERHFEEALALHATDDRPFERGRTSLLYGEFLRRRLQRGEARVHLGTALQLFESLGAAPWAERARMELDASGASVARTSVPDTFASLTPQELQITQLAAQGLTNRDIAAQLFLSPRTVAYHLYKAYPKLGIASRAELAELR
ncbi:ATP-binding protein [Tenggerimyces flavus]|uniref:ATP-binding protein n=1 Tax=Tenggerimyces flavus TaxID=1708749 RepID=A0ABV7YHV0_9ACTN|nr:LuxR family transcriptional regulator [Tenggerimyces flavus]MBM7787638.1 DNA-binding CsgD family transcriptional regulator [Tenggerimyces flavus]